MKIFNIFKKKSTVRIPNIQTLSSLVDRLAIEVSKVSYWENLKRLEHQKEIPNKDLIVEWDNLSRDANEIRSAIKKMIDDLFQEVIDTGKYTYLREPRTFSPAAVSQFSDLLDKRYSIIGDLAATNSLQDALEKVLSGE